MEKQKSLDEAMLLNWMQLLGYADATICEGSSCPTIRCSEVVAQVDAGDEEVSLLAVQAVNGVAAYEQKVPMFFAAGGFSADAKRWAEGACVALMRIRGGSIEGVGWLGRAFARRIQLGIIRGNRITRAR